MGLANEKVSNEAWLLDMCIQGPKVSQILGDFRYSYGAGVWIWALHVMLLHPRIELICAVSLKNKPSLKESLRLGLSDVDRFYCLRSISTQWAEHEQHTLRDSSELPVILLQVSDIRGCRAVSGRKCGLRVRTLSILGESTPPVNAWTSVWPPLW